ncbi:MAG TPA: hypothetical protein PKV93_13525 [Fervidobacterium sp.]|nr:hypothetical protein [Fervidobacterium sp.]
MKEKSEEMEVKEDTKQEEKQAVKLPEDTYTIEDFVANADAFGVKPEAIIGAMKLAGKDVATKEEMAKYLAEFLRKEV